MPVIVNSTVINAAVTIQKGKILGVTAKTYLPILLKAWNAMVKDAVHPNGFLGYVQGTGKEPKDGQPVIGRSAISV